jgi:acetyl-CoA carboxylase biotin carboxyl carrier protein
MKEMNQTDLTKLEVESEGIRICMEKGSNQAAVVNQGVPQFISMPHHIPQTGMIQAPYAAATGYIGQAPAEVAQNQTVPTTQAQTTAPTVETAGTKKLVSPMVGTFYAQSSPDKPAFVKVGDKVKKGQTICIIEAMKLMNEIESEYDGEIVEVLVKNEDMVEFGQPLFLIK